MDLAIERQSRAYLDFIQGVKANTRGETMMALRTVYDGKVAAQGEAPASWQEVGPLLHGEPAWSWYGLASRWSQEQMWAEIARIIEANREAVDAALADQPADPQLVLDPGLELPRYYTAVEFHLRPGGMWDGQDQGLLTDLADTIYGRGQNDDHRAQRWVAQQLPEPAGGPPRRVLDLACGIGKMTWPLQDRFPDAEVHGCDLSGPLLRFARQASRERARTVWWKQANAEATGYPDGYFDLITAYILFHELPDPAARRVLAEVRRLLSPGGVFAIADIRSYERQGPLAAYISDWQTGNNNEYYWRSHCSRDYGDWLREAGFVDVTAADSPVNRNSMLYIAHVPGGDPR